MELAVNQQAPGSSPGRRTKELKGFRDVLPSAKHAKGLTYRATTRNQHSILDPETFATTPA